MLRSIRVVISTLMLVLWRTKISAIENQDNASAMENRDTTNNNPYKGDNDGGCYHTIRYGNNHQKPNRYNRFTKPKLDTENGDGDLPK